MAMVVGMPFSGEGKSVFLSQKRDLSDLTGRCLHSAAKVPLSSYFIREGKGLKCSWEGCGLLDVSWAGSSPFLGMKLLQPFWLPGSGQLQ